MTSEQRLREALRQWKCPACNGKRRYTGYSKDAPEGQECRKCKDTDGLHSVAWAALSSPSTEGQPAEAAPAEPWEALKGIHEMVEEELRNPQWAGSDSLLYQVEADLRALLAAGPALEGQREVRAFNKAIELAAQTAEHPERSDFVKSYKEAWDIEEGKKVAAAVRALTRESRPQGDGK